MDSEQTKEGKDEWRIKLGVKRGKKHRPRALVSLPFTPPLSRIFPPLPLIPSSLYFPSLPLPYPILLSLTSLFSPKTHPICRQRTRINSARKLPSQWVEEKPLAKGREHHWPAKLCCFSGGMSPDGNAKRRKTEESKRERGERGERGERWMN